MVRFALHAWLFDEFDLMPFFFSKQGTVLLPLPGPMQPIQNPSSNTNSVR